MVRVYGFIILFHIRSDRKTVQLRITEDGIVEVRAPLAADKAWLDKFVASKEKWIAAKLSATASRVEAKQEFVIDYGRKLLWLGSELPLIAEHLNGIRMWLDESGFHLPSGLDEETLKYNVIRLYKSNSLQYLKLRVAIYAKRMGVAPAAVKVSEAKTRWGSCSGQKNINFSWRLCMAEPDTIDSVIVHELAHLKEMNHSDRFYKLVYKVMPDYDERNGKLKDLSQRLGYEDWEV